MGVKEDFSATVSTTAVMYDTVNSRVTGSEAVVNSTANPLVALYSAPPCEQGTMAVKFRPAAGANHQEWTRTDTLDCVPGKSRNFLVAGMLANTTYEMVDITTEKSSPALLFTTRVPPSTLDIPRFTVRQEPGGGSDPTNTATLNEVVDHYVAFFKRAARLNPPPNLPPILSSNGRDIDRGFINDDEKPALLAYLRKL